MVIGLGRFGSALAQELYNEGHEVMGIDTDEALVQSCKEFLTHAEICSATDIDTLRQLGVGDVQRAVVAIGSALENSILATANLAELGVPEIWAKALTEQHRRILERIGAHHIVRSPRVTRGGGWRTGSSPRSRSTSSSTGTSCSPR
ncbi:MAG: TrkA family potassium uptake protein [Microthrixaceae bacterium]